MEQLHCYVKSFVVLTFFAAPLAAGPYSELIIFGDTLSDNGNASQATFGLQPGPVYSKADSPTVPFTPGRLRQRLS